VPLCALVLLPPRQGGERETKVKLQRFIRPHSMGWHSSKAENSRRPYRLSLKMMRTSCEQVACR
jgi:hypothetical protein